MYGSIRRGALWLRGVIMSWRWSQHDGVCAFVKRERKRKGTGMWLCLFHIRVSRTAISWEAVCRTDWSTHTLALDFSVFWGSRTVRHKHLLLEPHSLSHFVTATQSPKPLCRRNIAKEYRKEPVLMTQWGHARASVGAPLWLQVGFSFASCCCDKTP